MPVTEYRGSRSQSATVELYQFIYGEGANDVYTFTNSEQPITYGDFTYAPLAISHDNIKSEGRPTGNELKITVPRSSSIAGHFRGVIPRRVIFIRIYQGDIPHSTDHSTLSDNASFDAIYFGRVTEASPRNSETVMTCNTAGMGMKRPGLTRNYQRQCAFVLYGERCQASRAAATQAATVATISGETVTLTSGWEGSRSQADFIGGIFEWTGTHGTEYRAILNCDGDTVTLDGYAPDLEAGDSVNMILGCNRTMGACTALHNNILNFGGEPYIPLENPVNKNNFT